MDDKLKAAGDKMKSRESGNGETVVWNEILIIR
jgi:hypothetical protein